MKSALQFKLAQHLTLTPQLQHSIKSLQLSTIELNQEINQLLLENPFLEREEPESSDEEETAFDLYKPDLPSSEGSNQLEEEHTHTEKDYDLFANTSFSQSGGEEEERDFSELHPEVCTLRQHLMKQLGLLNLPPRDQNLATVLIESLDENGYLTQSIEEITQGLPKELEIAEEEMRIALNYIQNLEPIGVGARSVSECLTLQLEALPSVTKAREVALKIVKQQEYLEALALRDFNKLKKNIGCNEEELKRAHELIKKLNPKPGSAFVPHEITYIVPDVIVKKVKNVWTVQANPAVIPRLRVNNLYADIIKSSDRATYSKFSSQLQEARWMIKNVQQRLDTILRVAQAIVERQSTFLEYGEVAMRPLVLREIADLLNLHESTISRVTTQKYMLTPRGIYELKYFFGSHVTTQSGGTCSATAIRAMIKQLINAENPTQPISDNQISRTLNQQGIVVARRTIAKYRESVNIPSLNMRRCL